MNSNIEQILLDNGYDEHIVTYPEKFNDSIEGISADYRLIYNYSKMIDLVMNADNIDYESAEKVVLDTINKHESEKDSPIIMYSLFE